MERGKKLLANNDFARAALEFRSAIQANPKNFEAEYELAQAELGLGDRVSAYRALTRALDLNPKHNGAQLLMADLLLTSSDPEDVKQAQKYAQAILDGSPDSPDALDALAAAELRLGDREKAQKTLEQARNKAPDHIQSALDLALLKLGNKDSAGAQKILEQAVETTPDSVQAQMILGAFYLMVGKLPAGEQQFRTILRKDPNNSLALVDLAMVLRSSGRNGEAEEIYRRLANDPKSPYRSIYGSYLLRAGREKEGLAELERQAKLDRNDINARTRLVAAYMATRRVAEAQQLLNGALKKNPTDAAALLQRGELSLLAGAYEEARKDLNSILHSTPDSAKAHFLLSSVERGEGKPLKQRQELAEAIRLDKRLFDARVALAQAYITAGDGGGALDLMNQTPDDQRKLGYIEYRNWALLASGNLEELQKGIAAGLAQATTRDLLLQDALLKLRQGNAAGGESRLFEILKTNPEDLGAVDVLIRSYAGRKRLPVAIEKVRMLIGERPKSAQLEYRLGMLLVSTRDTQGARAAYTAAIQLDPQFSEGRLALAALDQAAGKPDAARQDLDPLLTSKGGEMLARAELSYIDGKSGDYSNAIEQLRKVVEAQPTNWVALNNLAYLLADHTAQTDDALKYAQKAKELAPNNFNVAGTLGWAYFRKGMYGPALQQLKEAVDHEGRSATDGTAIRRYHLAMAYAKTGDEANAVKTLSGAVALDPSLPESRMATQVLGELR